MESLFKSAALGQMLGALSMLRDRIDSWPDESWHAPIGNWEFNQAAFHVLFWTDMYLGPNPEALKSQAFHQAHPEIFRSYEELEPKVPELHYDRSMLKACLEHCRQKTSEVIAAETAESLAGPSGFPWLPFERAEVYLYNLRHVQHHAAQFILRERIDRDGEARWHKSGWGE